MHTHTPQKQGILKKANMYVSCKNQLRPSNRRQQTANSLLSSHIEVAQDSVTGKATEGESVLS